MSRFTILASLCVVLTTTGCSGRVSHGYGFVQQVTTRQDSTGEIIVAHDWYYAKDDQRVGPVTAAQLRDLARSGHLTSNGLVQRGDKHAVCILFEKVAILSQHG